MLSAHDMNRLRITSRADMTNLRLHCCTYGRQKPEKNRVGCGAPEFSIPKSLLEDHLEEGFTIEEIFCMLSVCERTNYRGMERYGLRALNFINISDDELDQHVTEAAKEFPFCGERVEVSSRRKRHQNAENKTKR